MTIYSGFSHWKWWFSIVMLVYQRVSALSNNLQPVCRPRQLPRHLLWLGLNDLITEYHRCQKWWHLIRNHHRSWMIDSKIFQELRMKTMFFMFLYNVFFSRIPEWWLANLANASWAPMPIASNVRESRSPGAKAGEYVWAKLCCNIYRMPQDTQPI